MELVGGAGVLRPPFLSAASGIVDQPRMRTPAASAMSIASNAPDSGRTTSRGEMDNVVRHSGRIACCGGLIKRPNFVLRIRPYHDQTACRRLRCRSSNSLRRGPQHETKKRRPALGQAALRKHYLLTACRSCRRGDRRAGSRGPWRPCRWRGGTARASSPSDPGRDRTRRGSRA
jgi:hypothetical protein